MSGEPCEDCGRPKSEYVDLGTKGHYECWWCTQRAADNLIEAIDKRGGDS